MDAGKRAFRKALLDPTLQAPRAVVRAAIARQQIRRELANSPPVRFYAPATDQEMDALVKKLEEREAWLTRMRGRKGVSP
jgi:hypothetical protein